MEFWGVEVKAGEALKVQPELGKLIHISQASLGESKNVKGAKNVPLRLKIDDKNFVIGTLAVEDRTQIAFDLVFEKEFELSHDYKNGSVYFLGYIADDPVSDGEDFSDEFEDDSEDELVEAPENVLVKPKSEDAKIAKNVKAGAKKVEQPESDEDEDDSDSADDSEEELPKVELPKVQQSKKRPAEAANVTPASNKKANAGKPVGKSPAFNKSKEQSPKSGGQFSRKSPNNSNSKAKRGGRK
ncbi:hypothetical protein ACJIZ3_017338 [Penstemon smallii]|uniref:Nucleoplasmin-like domain-containing protein n=1 Tax=Penstemon smallii TaxID=265156 RepID=A0ABD3SW09_9LAMI